MHIQLVHVFGGGLYENTKKKKNVRSHQILYMMKGKLRVASVSNRLMLSKHGCFTFLLCNIRTRIYENVYISWHSETWWILVKLSWRRVHDNH